jgi:hypothetical protein
MWWLMVAIGYASDDGLVLAMKRAKSSTMYTLVCFAGKGNFYMQSHILDLVTTLL